MRYSLREMLNDELRIQNSIINNCSECIDFVIENLNYNYELFKKIDPGKLYFFFNYYGQYNKAIMLAMLSIIRMHDYQHKYNMRYALESAAIMTYSLYNGDIENDQSKYYSINEKGEIKPNNKLLKNSYKLVGEKYPDVSDRMIYFKGLYNQVTHSNSVNTGNNFDADEDGFGIRLFDNYEESCYNHALINIHLWSISDVNIGIIGMIIKGLKENNLDQCIVKNYYNSYLEMQNRLSELKKEVGTEFNKHKKTNIHLNI